MGFGVYQAAGNSSLTSGGIQMGQISGQYRLVQVDEHWDVIREKSSKNRYEIKDTIEDWMNNPVDL